MTLATGGLGTAPARVDVIGSLLRPPRLVEAFGDFSAGTIGPAQLRAIQDETIEAAIAEQEACGLPVVTDGEFRRQHFMESFADVTGFAHGRLAPLGVAVITSEEPAADAQGSRTRGYLARGRTIEPLRLVHNRVRDEFVFAQAASDRIVKASLINCGRIIEGFDADGSRDVYEGVDEFVADVVKIQREIVGQLIEVGCRYVHIDAPGYTAYIDEGALAAMRERDEDPVESLDRAIHADNAVVEGFEGTTFGIHMCRGNFRGQWAREGTYDDSSEVTERLYTQLRHERLMLEYDSDRAGGFETLRFVPKGKIAVLGLVSTKSRRIETVDELLRRIEEASRFLAVEQLAISPQCGFGSVLDGNPLDEELQWRKLEVLVETASRAWP